MVNDHISDMIARINNGYRIRAVAVEMRSSNAVEQVAKILAAEGYIGQVTTQEGNIKMELKYNQGKPAMTGIKRVSKPGARVYSKIGNLKKVWGGWGVAVLSTSKGVMSEKTARKTNIGGEVICQVW